MMNTTVPSYHLSYIVWGINGLLALLGAGIIVTVLFGGVPGWVSMILGGVIVLVSLIAAIYLMIAVAQPIQRMAGEVNTLLGDPDLHMQGSSSSVQGGGNEVDYLSSAIAGLGQNVREKVHWYVGILDAIPFPLSVTDMNMNWTLINRPVEQFLKVKRESVLGHQCDEWNANICNTENCGIARLRKNFLQTFFDQQGGNFQVDTSYLYSLKGEKIGHVEVVQDITRMVSNNKYQEKAIAQIAGYLTQMSQGNLAFKIAALPEATEAQKDAKQNFQKILDDLGRARTMLSETLRLVANNIGTVISAANTQEEVARQAGMATSQISTTIQQVAKGTSQQVNAISGTSLIIQNMTDQVSVVAKGAQGQAEAIQSALTVTGKISARDGLAARVGLSAQSVKEMGQRSEQIGAIIVTIEDISSQTNLLALNAAIEAARAGEHGKGFAVVADEVRKLAERSSVATKEIGGLIKGIQSSVSGAVEMTTSVASELEKASVELETAIEQVSKVIETNLSASETLTTSSRQVMESVENVASVSEENSAAVEEVSASTEEMTAQVAEVSESAQSLAAMVSNLKEIVSKFQV
jgi:methyl-accepting chemotaxis protein